MARPLKQGLDYFPLDVDIDQDDKVQLVEALHGNTGFYVLIKLLMKVYKEGYFYPWAESEQILFSKRVNVDINILNDIVNDCIKYGVFHKGMYEKHKILTSKGIQERFFEASKRRKKIDYVGEYLLIKVENVVNVNNNSVNENINPQAEGVNDDISTQRKVKERKVKETKENSVQKAELFETWWTLYGNKKGKVKCETKYASLLKKYSHEQIMEGTHHYLNHRESLAKRGEFVPQQKNPLTFLNGEHFNDEYEGSNDPVHVISKPKEYVPDFNAGED